MTTPQRNGKSLTRFADWVRRNNNLDSRDCGLALMDIDWIWHRYLVPEDTMGKRRVNHIMFIEEKQGDEKVTFAQSDLMGLINQACQIADRRKLMTARGERVMVRFWGHFVLRHLLTTSPKLFWNEKEITLKQLEKILLFELNPRTLHPRSDRRHHTKPYLLF